MDNDINNTQNPEPAPENDAMSAAENTNAAENAAEDTAAEAQPVAEERGIEPVKIEDEMHQSFLDYSMSVIVGRALPDARDGMKPVHRRCVYTMGEMNNTHATPHKKSARVVGEIMGKYHPHGDSSIYDTIVRLAQPFSMRYRLVDGHGNFGSMDGDEAAAMRYTEVRMQQFAEDMLEDLDKDTVDMVPNYDGTLEEPTVLPSKLPNLLLNGSMGIAVGMATNIPTHNLNELVDAIVAMVRNPAITIGELMQHVKGPDFPTGGIICGVEAIRKMYTTGRASICVRARTEITEDKKGNTLIVVHEIPYGVNKAEMLAHIGELIEAKDGKRIEGIADIRDLSKADVRIEITLKPGTSAHLVLNLLFKYSELQINFGANMLALDRGRPKVMNLKQFLRCFIDHRIEVVTRRTKFLLRKAKERAHLLEGFRVAIDNIDEIVHIIRSSANDDEAKARMLERFGLDDIQASAILEMRLRQLTGLQRERIETEYQEKLADIERYTAILGDQQKVLDIIVEESEEMKRKYGDARRTTISAQSGDVGLESVIPNEPCVITLTARGYIKRSSLEDLREHKRGGKGQKGNKNKENDSILQVVSTMTHDSLLFFTDQGRVLTLERAWEIGEAEFNSHGLPVVNYILLRPEIKEGQRDKDDKPLQARPAEKVINIISIGNHNDATLSEEAKAATGRFAVNEKRPLFDNERALLFATRKGMVKKTVLSEFRNINKNGINAISLDDDDALVGVILVERDTEVILFSAHGQAVHCNESQFRAMGRTARGVRGIRLAGVTFSAAVEETEDSAEVEDAEEEDAVESAGAATPDSLCALVRCEKDPGTRVLLLSENGYGTLNTFASYPVRKRGGKGVKSLKTAGRNGSVVFAGTVFLGDSAVDPATGTRLADSLLVITTKGQIIRTGVTDIRETGRGAMGVRIINLEKDDKVASASIAQNFLEPERPAAEDDKEEPSQTSNTES